MEAAGKYTGGNGKYFVGKGTGRYVKGGLEWRKMLEPIRDRRPK